MQMFFRLRLSPGPRGAANIGGCHEHASGSEAPTGVRGGPHDLIVGRPGIISTVIHFIYARKGGVHLRGRKKFSKKFFGPSNGGPILAIYINAGAESTGNGIAAGGEAPSIGRTSLWLCGAMR